MTDPEIERLLAGDDIHHIASTLARLALDQARELAAANARIAELVGENPDTYVGYWRGMAYPSNPKLLEIMTIQVIQAITMSTAITEVREGR